MIFLLAGGTGERGTPCGNISPLQAAEGDTLRQGVPTLPSAAPVGASGGPAATPLPAAAPTAVPTYQYNTAGKSDPFKPFMETDPALKKKMEEEQKKKVTLKRPISPLQQSDIGHFRLVGIAGDQYRRTAIVEDGAAKKYYPLFVGTYIGLNGGRVAAILPDRVVVEEKAEKQGKKAQIKRMTVMLHKEEEGKP
jgi:type IV pilus assembly protein PilP